MRNITLFLIFSVILLIIGRNLTFLPTFGSPSKKVQGENITLKKGAQEIISKQKGNYSIYYYNFSDDSFFGINEKEVQEAASVNKVPIVAVLYYLSKQNEISLDEQITVQEDDIQDYGTGVIRYDGAGQTYTLKSLAKLALKNSDNTAAYIIAGRIGREKVQSVINSWGLKQTDIENNKTSAFDMHILFKKIYKGEITSPQYKDELLGFMKDTDIEDRLPYLLPEGAVSYHKTGDGVGVINDVGIITYDGKAYFLGILASDIGQNEKEAKGAIAKISKEIFDKIK